MVRDAGSLCTQRGRGGILHPRHSFRQLHQMGSSGALSHVLTNLTWSRGGVGGLGGMHGIGVPNGFPFFLAILCLLSCAEGRELHDESSPATRGVDTDGVAVLGGSKEEDKHVIEDLIRRMDPPPVPGLPHRTIRSFLYPPPRFIPPSSPQRCPPPPLPHRPPCHLLHSFQAPQEAARAKMTILGADGSPVLHRRARRPVFRKLHVVCGRLRAAQV